MIALMFAICVADPADSGLPSKPGWVVSERIRTEHATQAAAADEHHFYAVSNTRVARLDRKSGKLLGGGTDPKVKHLNSAFVWKGRVYCAHSNYPDTPHKSDIWVFDPADDSLDLFHRFEEPPGSLVWCVREPADRFWWCCFAHYDGDNAKTVLVKMNDRFRELRRWRFPDRVIKDWDGMSASGGIWDGDTILASHHHFRVLYRLELPKDGKRLELVETLRCPFPGQGFAIDPNGKGRLVGIDRPRREVITASRAKQED